MIIVLILAASVFAQADMSKNQTRDEMISVGAYRLHLRCLGAGSPTVVLEAGLASPATDWDKVMPGVSQFTRVCAYDRANIGKSEAAPKPRTAAQLNADLRALLEKSGEPTPIILVGHSFGGLYSILYSSRYPQDVAGMVLVDSSHEDQIARFEAIMTPEQLKESRARRRTNAEGINPDAVRAEVRALRWRTEIPLYVLVHGANKPDMNPPGWTPQQIDKRSQAWLEMQTDFARRSKNGKLIIAQKSGHYIQTDEPELVIDAIKQAVEQARRKMKKTRK